MAKTFFLLKTECDKVVCKMIYLCLNIFKNDYNKIKFDYMFQISCALSKIETKHTLKCKGQGECPLILRSHSNLV